MKSVLLTLSTILTVSFGILDPELCSTAGPICVSCSQLATCVKTGSSFHIIHLQNCKGGETCSLDGCTTSPVPECEHRPLEFQCNDIGMFPDPFDCQQYHYCVPYSGKLKRYTDRCEAGFGYDSSTTFCSNRLAEDNVCPELPIPECLRPGQTGALSNLSLYYICAEYSDVVNTLYPLLFACPFGGKYDSFTCKAASRANVESILSKFGQ